MPDQTHAPLRALIVIPARLASTRLPRKLLLAETGRPLIQHTYEAARRATRVAGVLIAADDEEIVSAVRKFGGRAELTNPLARSGTDRVAEIAARNPEMDVFVNVQGDEPEVSGAAIDLLVGLLADHPQEVMATLAAPIRNRDQLQDPSCVKVVFDGSKRALYFSRSVIPHPREWSDSLLSAEPPSFYQHLGVYAYRRDFLLRLASLPESQTERLEKLEQLRVLDAGYRILVGIIDEPTIGIDTPADYRAFVSRCLNR